MSINRDNIVSFKIGLLIFIVLTLSFLIQGCAPEGTKSEVLVEGGSFMMGCNECQESEKPEHKVNIGTFWIDSTETTTNKYVEFLNEELDAGLISVSRGINDYGQVLTVTVSGVETNLIFSDYYQDGILYDNRFSIEAGSENLPVLVNWYGAKLYCEHYGKRLPTEAEWEYAAKGGKKNGKGGSLYYRYSGSDDPNSVAWSNRNSSEATVKRRFPVAQKKSNDLGIYDMSGNVREWVSDWYDPHYYSVSPERNPQGPAYPGYIDCYSNLAGKIMRGGSFDEWGWNCETNVATEETIDNKLGIRVTIRTWG